MNRPVVLVPARQTSRGPRLIDYVGELHLTLLIKMQILPLIVPVVEGTTGCLHQYMREMNGLLLVEGEDIEPKHYAAQKENFGYLEKTHPLKDEIEMVLLRNALHRKLPILGICRGSQLLNVVCGGTLYGDVRKEKRSKLKHLDSKRYDTYRHSIDVVSSTPLEHWYRSKNLRVNSYHHQGVRLLAKCFRPMAYAEDGLIEAYYDPKAEFVVGLQFHPERMLSEHAGHRSVWEAFGKAVQRRFRARLH